MVIHVVVDIQYIFESCLVKLRNKLSRKFDISVVEFQIWFDAILNHVKFKVKTLTQAQLASNDIFKQHDVVKYLEDFHSRFVVVPVDKASNNFAIVCKKFYLEVLMKELGISNGNIVGNEVYKHVKISDTKFFAEQGEANLNLRNSLELNNLRIPLLYWTSKQHKSPYKVRFISGASHCYNKTISVEVSLALKCIKEHFKNYCAVIKKRLGIDYFWSIDNSVEFVDKLSDIGKAVSIKTYDFSTLYTNLPLDYIYSMLEKLIMKMYNNSGSDMLLVNADRRKAFWYKGTKYPGYKDYTRGDLLDSLKYILYNTYVQFAGNKFKQTRYTNGW